MIGNLIEFKEVTLEWEAETAPGRFLLFTDLSTGVETQAASISLPVGRRTDTFPLDGIKAVSWRPEGRPGTAPDPVGNIAFYGGSIKFRTIGLYLRGNKNEVWRPQPKQIAA